MFRHTARDTRRSRLSRRRAVVLRSIAIVLAAGQLAAESVAAAEPVGADAAGRRRRIVGGFEATPGDWPFVAAIKSKGGDNFDDQFCAGSLVRPTWVLTAAHCFFGSGTTQVVEAGDIDVVLGLHDLVLDEGEEFAPLQVVIHPDYDPNDDDSDIALIELDRPSEASLAAFEDPGVTEALVDGDLLTTIGWGDTAASGPADFPDTLQQVMLPYVSTATCAAEPPYLGSVTENMFCAGFPEGGKDTCRGDSGGPSMVQVGKEWHVVGITSWGFGCAEPEMPGVLTKVANFGGWATAVVPEPGGVALEFAALAGVGFVRLRALRGRRANR